MRISQESDAGHLDGLPIVILIVVVAVVVV